MFLFGKTEVTLDAGARQEMSVDILQLISVFPTPLRKREGSFAESRRVKSISMNHYIES